MKKVGFSIYSFKICAYIYAININSDASYWGLFRKGIREEPSTRF